MATREEEKAAELREMPDFSIRQLLGMYDLFNVPGAYLDGLPVATLLRLTREEAQHRLQSRGQGANINIDR